MGIGGSSAAGLLLLLFCLAAGSSMINGKIARRATPSSTEINREMLSIAESRNAILRRSNAGGKLDQSKISMVNAEDMKDLENLEHVLSVVGYEPQKVANAEKRKLADTLNVVQDSDRVASSPRESADPTADVNHEVPRTVQPSRIAIIPQRSSRSKQNTQKPKSPIEARLSRPRSPLNLSSTAPTRDETKLAPLHGVYSITTPSNDDTYSRKRNRKRVTTRRDEESASSSTENYPRQFPKVRGSANKSGRLSSRTKLAFRPFASNFVESRKGNLEKFVDKEVALNGIRSVRGKNIQENAARTGYGDTLEGVGSGSGKLHERKDTGVSPANVEDDSLSADLRESDAIGDKTSKSDGDGAYKSSEMSEESGSSKEEVASSTNTNGSDLDNSLKEMVATSSSFESHRDAKIPAVAEHSPRSSNYVHRSSSLSTVDPPATSTDSWTNEPEQRSAKTQSDGVAEATSVENGEEDEKYERHEDRQLDNHDLPSHEYIHENERAPEGVKDDVDAFKKDEDGRQAEKYDVRVKGDVASDGSHDTESHRGAKEGAAGANAAGRGKFEKGGATERKQEHRETDGEKGEKGYESWHEEEKLDKGHHDKEQRSNYYDEKDGKKKEENEEGGYHEEHEEGEKGEKKAEFDDKGEHQKGYNTKGQHLVHKKDEFEKRTEFFDEFHEDGDAENDGEFYHERKMSKGGDYKAGHHDAGDHEQTFGKKSEYEKSGHHRDNKGHEIKGGEDSHHEEENMHGEKKSHQGGKKWTYKNGADEADKKGH
ncbi:hypothetical protein K0M31_017204 [Melipona bicolor]|uniref:Uncharacterized protein n=1 Tax=Melipona bicolor TaxID=60889 RepID=A0AA40G4G1_9HYME|nr:hypothetical protein K0M31_017204 [Melipona bicolor]